MFQPANSAITSTIAITHIAMSPSVNVTLLTLSSSEAENRLLRDRRRLRRLAGDGGADALISVSPLSIRGDM
jgi:hypothetical protein